MSNNNNNNRSKKSSKKAGEPKKFGPLTEVASLRRDLDRVRRDLVKGSKNPQALERRRQARGLNKMARGTQIDMGRLFDARGLRDIRDPITRMHHHVANWVRQQSYPSRHMGVHPPYTDNACQSVQVTAARTVRMDNMTVVAGQCRQLSLLARGLSNEATSVNDTFNQTYAAMTGQQDATSFHTRPICYRNGGGTASAIIAFPVTTRVPKNVAGVVGEAALISGIGLMSESGSGIGLLAGQCLTQLNAAASGVRWSVMSPTTGLPYNGTSLGHVRAILTGLEVKLLNTTAQGSRAGSVVSVTVPHDFEVVGVSLQMAFSKFKTYKIHAIDDEITIVVPTRPTDMCYQHPNANPIALGVGGAASEQLWYESVFAATVRNAAAHIWINNPSAVDQTWAYEITANWSIAGDLVAGISEEAPLSTGSKGLIVDASVKQAEAPHTTPAQVGSSFMRAAADSVESSFKGLAGKLAAYGIKKIGEAAA